jgi:hypothetical protein
MNGREGSSDDHAVPAPMRCEAITTSGARCKNHGYLGMGRKGRKVCGTHRDAVRFISEERQREGIEQYKADRTPQELAVLAAIDRSPVAGMLQMQQIVDAMTSSERALFPTWGDLYPVIHMLQWKCGLRTRRCERGGVTELFVLRPPGVVAKLKAAERATWGEYPAGELMAMVETLERVKPWPVTSSAPSFMRTLRDLAGEYERVKLSPRQMEWLELLLARAKQMVEREPPSNPPVEAQQPTYSGNVIQLRPRGRV